MQVVLNKNRFFNTFAKVHNRDQTNLTVLLFSMRIFFEHYRFEDDYKIKVINNHGSNYITKHLIFLSVITRRIDSKGLIVEVSKKSRNCT